jgi:hypothetical protein
LADAVVGTLRALLALDTAQFEAGSRKATSAANSLDKSLEELGKETARLTPQAERMVKAFSGDRLMASANNLTAAVTKIGGASRLTEAEQARVNRTLTDAIAKYTALGQKAPADMLALQRATLATTASTTRFGDSLSQVNKLAGIFGISLGVGAVVAFGRELLQTADELVKVADRTGLTTTEVQKLKFVAEQSGNSLDDFTGAIARLQNNLVSGDKSAVNALKVLNINMAALRASTPLEQLEQIGRSIAKIPDPAARAALAIDLFGRSGATILPTLIADFERLGNAAPIMSDKTVRALDQAGDSLNKFQLQMKVWAAEFLNFAGRMFDTAVAGIQRGTAAIIDGMANLVGSVAKLPGAQAMFNRFGMSVDSLREKAQFLRDTADATTSRLTRIEPEIRKTTSAVFDYEQVTGKAAKTTDQAAEALKRWHASYGDLSSVMVRLVQTGQDANDVTRDTLRLFTALPPSIDSAGASLNAHNIIAGFGVDAMADYAAATKAANAELLRMGMLLPGLDVASENASHSLQDMAGEPSELMRTLGNTVETLNIAIAGSFAQMALGAKNFKDAWVDIWESIKAFTLRVFSEIAGAFLTGLLKKMAAGLAGTAVAGGVAGAAVGAGAAAATGGAAVAGGAGLGATALGLATNPITLAIAGGIGAFFLGRKLFGGGEEAEINPRRDQFMAQPKIGGSQKLASTLTRLSGQPGGGPLFSALQGADTVKRWEEAQKATIAFLASSGIRGVKSFAMGGFVPPGMTVPAMLHGGAFGEDIVPRSRPNSQAQRMVHVTVNVNTIDERGVRDFVKSRAFTDSLAHVFELNTGFVATHLKPSLR